MNKFINIFFIVLRANAFSKHFIPCTNCQFCQRNENVGADELKRKHVQTKLFTVLYIYQVSNFVTYIYIFKTLNKIN